MAESTIYPPDPCRVLCGMSSRESPIAAQRARNARLTAQAEQIARADGAMYAGKDRGRDRVIPIQA